MKEGSLFCSYQIHWISMLQIVFLVSLESSQREWVHGLGSMTIGLAVQKMLNIEWFLHSWIFWRRWNVPLVLLKRFWWAGFNGIYLVRFGFRMWETLILKWFLLLKIQINSKKPGWEHGNTSRLTIHSVQARFPFIFGCSKNRIIHCKTMFTCWLPYSVMGSHLGQQHKPH